MLRPCHAMPACHAHHAMQMCMLHDMSIPTAYPELHVGNDELLDLWGTMQATRMSV
jgi:hypothetical protein